MNRFFAQMVCPFWAALQSCGEMLASDAPNAMKVDALVSRVVHTFNHSHSDLNIGKTAPGIGSTVIRRDAEYFRIGSCRTQIIAPLISKGQNDSPSRH
jgi:hypothetical protein